MTRDPRFHGQAGLTFPELIVVSFILVTLVALVHATFRYQVGSQRREFAKVATQTDLRVWLERMVRDIREAGYDPCYETGDVFTIQTASPTELTFTLDYDGDCDHDAADSRENVGYRLNGDALELWRGGSSWRPVVQNVSNLSFTCLDAEEPPREFTCSATDESMRRSIAAVRVEISAQAETGGVPTMAPPVITQQATAELRNEIL